MKFYSAAVQCPIERVVLGLLVKCAQILCHGTRNFSNTGSSCGTEQEWGCTARPTECEISSQSGFICWPEYPKKFLCSATAWPSEMLVWVKGSEQNPPIVSIVGIQKETRSKEIHDSYCHWLHFPPRVAINETLLAIINLFTDGFVYAALQSRGTISAPTTFCHGFSCPGFLQCYFSRDSDTVQCLSCIYLFNFLF